MKARLVFLGALAATSVIACDGLLGINLLDGGPPPKDAGRLDVAVDDSGAADDAGSNDASEDASDDAPPPGSDFALSAGGQRVTIVRGGSAEVPISVGWGNAVAEAVTVTAPGLPAGVTADPLVIIPPATGGTLTLHATATATLTVTGTVAIMASGGAFTHVVALPLVVRDPPGILDLTFGVKGISTVALPGGLAYAAIGGYGLTFQADGSIVYCGNGKFGDNQEIVLGRLTTDGSIDTGFGDHGLVITNVPGHAVDVCASVKVLPSGSLALAGFTQDPNSTIAAHGFMAAQFTDAGAVDDNFGTGGFFWQVMGVDSKANDFVVEPDGHLVLGGFSTPPSAAGELTFLRLQSTGKLDLTFGPDGAGTALFPAWIGNGEMAVFSNGNVLSSSLTSTSFLNVQVDPEGAIDSAYGVDGGATGPAPPAFTGASGMILQSDGSTVLAGAGGDPTAVQLARFDAFGRLDGTFGKGGLASTTIPALPGGKTSVGAIALTADGGFAVATLLPTHTPIGVVRYDATGALDLSFAGIGYAGIAGYSYGDAVAVDAWGRIVIAAITMNTLQNTASVVLARYWP